MEKALKGHMVPMQGCKCNAAQLTIAQAALPGLTDWHEAGRSFIEIFRRLT